MPPTWLPLLVCALGLAAVALRFWRMRRSGVDPWALPDGDDALAFLGGCYFWLGGAAVFLLVAWGVAPSWSLRVFGALPLLLHPAPAWTGIAFVTIGIAVVIVAQREMGLTWRIGIRATERPALVTSGLYRFSRNPIFLGVLVAATGVALAIPHALAFALLAATFVAVSVQVRLEEAYLEGWLGAEYSAYKGRTGRWISLR